MAHVTELPTKTPPETEDADDFLDAAEATPAPSAPEPAKKPTGKPQKQNKRSPEATHLRFADKVAAIPKEDWGSLAFMYVYCTEPFLSAKAFGESKFMLKCSAPIDIDQLKQDYGSFKGYITLNVRKAGFGQTDQIDRLDFEIYDPKHPPRIPKISWLNDPRNARWEALLPPPPPAPAAAGSLMEGINAYKAIKADIKEELDDRDEEPRDPMRASLENIKLMKEIVNPPQPTNIGDNNPFSIAAKVMEMRSNDPMIGLLMKRMEAQDAQIEASRAREFQLQKEILDAKIASVNGGKSGDVLERLFELADNESKLDKLVNVGRKLFGLGDGPAPRGRTSLIDGIKEVADSPFGQQIGLGIAQLMANLSAPRPIVANGSSAVAPVSSGPVPAAESDEARIRRIATNTFQTMLYEFFLKDLPGGDFASWMFEGMPEDVIWLQQKGAEQILKLINSNPQAVVLIGQKGPQFATFIQEFCEWKPDGSDEPPAPGKQAEEDDDFSEGA